jgi:hypothetical protein
MARAQPEIEALRARGMAWRDGATPSTSAFIMARALCVFAKRVRMRWERLPKGGEMVPEGLAPGLLFREGDPVGFDRGHNLQTLT